MSSATATWSTSASMSDRTLGIVGVGLIGGSIGMAARRAGWEVVGVDRAATLERALALGAIDRPADLDGVRGAEMVVLAAPVSQITGLLAELAPTDALVSPSLTLDHLRDLVTHFPTKTRWRRTFHLIHGYPLQ